MLSNSSNKDKKDNSLHEEDEGPTPNNNDSSSSSVEITPVVVSSSEEHGQMNISFGLERLRKALLTPNNNSPSDSNGDSAKVESNLPQNQLRRLLVSEPWQLSMSSLKDRIGYLYNNETLSDIGFIVGSATSSRIPAHKFILSISSPVFDAMFNGPLALGDEEKTVSIPDVETEAFYAMLKFLYTDEVILTPDNVISVMYSARKYSVSLLEEQCVSFLKDNLTPDNAFFLLSQARIFDETQLTAYCLDCIDKNTALCMSTEYFLDLDSDTLCLVLERDSLRIKELCLFHFVLKWASHECERKGIESSAENQREVLGKALHCIRFPLIPVEEFCLHVAQLGILTLQELVDLFLNFNITSNYMDKRPKIKFIDRTRCYMTGKQLSVNRFLETETRWGYNGLSDQIRFTTDRRIYVVGLGLYGGLFNTKEYRADIQLSSTTHGTVLGHRTDSFMSDGTKTIYKVMFKEPIEILPESTYTASATLRGPDSYYGSKGQRNVTIECPDGSSVNFTFSYSSDNNNGTTVEDGQIPEIIFHT